MCRAAEVCAAANMNADDGAWDAYVRAANAQAVSAMSNGNLPFGAVLVLDGDGIVLRAQHSALTDCDPTCMPELNLIRQAAKVLPKADLARATMVSSTEPCPMCAGDYKHAAAPAGMPDRTFGTSHPCAAFLHPFLRRHLLERGETTGRESAAPPKPAA